jgi:UDP-N-acetylmuramoyl-L-alanyl-D-glutamate--2,6-diaminopimelate ligase
MILEELLNRIPVLEISGSKTLEISEIVFDSRKAVENSLYVAVKGTVSDGHSFINSAIEKGAKAIVCEVLPENSKNRYHLYKSERCLKNFRSVGFKLLWKSFRKT